MVPVASNATANAVENIAVLKTQWEGPVKVYVASKISVHSGYSYIVYVIVPTLF